jgi:hypothetical protein
MKILQNVLIGGKNFISGAILQIDSTTQGILIPRMTTTQRDAISSPAISLLIFNSTTNQYEYFEGTVWVGIRDKKLSQTATPTANGTITVNPKTEFVFFDNAANITTYTINMPAAVKDLDIVAFFFGTNSVNAITWNANSAGRVFNTNATIANNAAGSRVRFIYRAANNKWYRLD